MMEAIVAAFLMFSAVACLQSISGHVSADGSEDLEQMSQDLLYILEHGENGPGHPGLAQALSSQTAWSEQSLVLDANIRNRMPAGYKVYLRTPYGDTGDCPPDRVAMSVRAFLAYRQETGETIGCSLIVWRP
jgi:hypothetical protein